MSVPQSFQKLLVRIAPTLGEEARARSHAETIRARLAASFSLKKFMIAGSVSRGTFIHNSSDIDLFAVISRDEARRGEGYVSSKTMLEKFRLELEDRYPSCVVYKDVHAIVVAYSDGCKVDVVPAVFFVWSKQNTPI
jgi:tRNA nucleotidyltransferase (CCA-adding enzyme)